MKNKRKYQGLGLIELIISIGVAGIAIVVLMSMAANSMQEAIRLERQDALTRLAQDGALVVRKHVEDENHPEMELDFSFIYGSVNRCYVVNIDDSQVEFSESSSVTFDSVENADEELIEAEEFYIDIIYDWDETESFVNDVYYLAYCIVGIQDSEASGLKTYIGSVITGYVHCSGCNISPYQHNIIVNVREEQSEE